MFFFFNFKIIFLLSPFENFIIRYSANFIFNIPLQHLLSNSLTTLSSFSSPVHVSDP
jgi:hypothetical protein